MYTTLPIITINHQSFLDFIFLPSRQPSIEQFYHAALLQSSFTTIQWFTGLSSGTVTTLEPLASLPLSDDTMLVGTLVWKHTSCSAPNSVYST